MLSTKLVGTGADQVIELHPSPATASTGDALRLTASTGYAKLSAALKNYARRQSASNFGANTFDSRWSGIFPTTDRASVGELPAPILRQFASSPANGPEITQRGAMSVPQLRTPPVRTASVVGSERLGRAVSDAPSSTTTVFEKLFGKPFRLTLAYAAPDSASLDDGQTLTSGHYDRWTAVYDISAHTVYMPDGTRLEAHSGLGIRLDDPRYVDEKRRGATPPNVYDLELREGLFHGVRALRLIPVDKDNVFGRTGLLAHPYMLGSNGDSNGCVSVKNYNAFLRAYMSHTIKRLAVVASLD